MAHLASETIDYRESLRATEVAKQYSNVYLDTSTVVITRYLEKAVCGVARRKAGVWHGRAGSRYSAGIFKIRVLKLPKEKEELILGGNMVRLLAKYRRANG